LLGCVSGFFSTEQDTNQKRITVIANKLCLALFVANAIGAGLTFVVDNEQSRYARNVTEWMMFACTCVVLSNFLGSHSKYAVKLICCDQSEVASTDIVFLRRLGIGIFGGVGVYLLLNQLVFSDTPADWQFNSFSDGYFQSADPKIIVAFFLFALLLMSHEWADSLLNIALPDLPSIWGNPMFSRPASGENAALLANTHKAERPRTPDEQLRNLQDGVLTPERPGGGSPSFSSEKSLSLFDDPGWFDGREQGESPPLLLSG
jgi:hypothetical protein